MCQSICERNPLCILEPLQSTLLEAIIMHLRPLKCYSRRICQKKWIVHQIAVTNASVNSHCQCR